MTGANGEFVSITRCFSPIVIAFSLFICYCIDPNKAISFDWKKIDAEPRRDRATAPESFKCAVALARLVCQRIDQTL